MADIDIGDAASDYSTVVDSGYTLINIGNPANASGTITSVQIFAQQTMANCKVGTFSGSGTTYTPRDSESLGAVTEASVQTFPGLDIDVESGDFIGIYFSAGRIEMNTADGSGLYYKVGDQFAAGEQTYSLYGAAYKIAVYGEGDLPAEFELGEAALASTASLASGQIRIRIGASTDAATASAATIGARNRTASLDASPVAAATIAGLRDRFSDPDLAATASAETDPAAIFAGKADKAAGVGLTAGGYRIRTFDGALEATAALTADWDRLRCALADLAASGALTGDAAFIAAGLAELDVTAALTAAAHPIGWVFAELAASAAITTDGLFIAAGKADLGPSASAGADACYLVAGVLTAAASPTVVVAPVRVRVAASTMEAAAALAAIAQRYYNVAEMTYTGTLTPGDVLEIDTDLMRVRLNGVNARGSFSGDFFKLVLGEQQLDWVDDDGTRTVGVSVDHKDRWA